MMDHFALSHPETIGPFRLGRLSETVSETRRPEGQENRASHPRRYPRQYPLSSRRLGFPPS
jgi:hypothetical protein